MLKSGNKRKAYAIVAIVLFLCIAAAWLLLSIRYLRAIDRNYYIFGDIQECRELAFYESDATVSTIESPEQDKKYQGQSFASFVGMRYQSEKMSFTLYAYEFDNNDQAKQYFQKVTGKKNDSKHYFSKSGGMSTYQIVIAYENKAYRLETKLRYIKQVDAMIAERFSVWLEW